MRVMRLFSSIMCEVFLYQQLYEVLNILAPAASTPIDSPQQRT
jgi:hypothetical protein